MAVDVATRTVPPPLEVVPPAEPIVEARGVDKIYDTGKVQVSALREV